MSYKTSICICRESEDDDSESREIEVEVSFTPGTPGRLYGPPEDCYPPEGPEVEVLSARFTDTGESVELTNHEYDLLAEKIEANAESAYADAMEAREEARAEARWESRHDRDWDY